MAFVVVAAVLVFLQLLALAVWARHLGQRLEDKLDAKHDKLVGAILKAKVSRAPIGFETRTHGVRLPPAPTVLHLPDATSDTEHLAAPRAKQDSDAPPVDMHP